MSKNPHNNKDTEIGLKHNFRSGLEPAMYDYLISIGYNPNYEGETYHYVWPAKNKKHTPDFPFLTLEGELPLLKNGKRLIVETKGRWVKADRDKIQLVLEQYPEIEIRMAFQNPNGKINKGSKTTYAAWCDKHSIKWCKFNPDLKKTKAELPKEWLEDINK